MEKIMILTLEEIQEAKKSYSDNQVFNKLDKLLDEANKMEEWELFDDILNCMPPKSEDADYELLASITKELGYKKVMDIGACLGVQKLYFDALGIQYEGIELSSKTEFCSDAVHYSTKYPCTLKNNGDVLMISNLCIGFLIDFLECLPHMAEDFHGCLLNCPRFTPEQIGEIEKDFEIIQIFPENEVRRFYYLRKKEEKI